MRNMANRLRAMFGQGANIGHNSAMIKPFWVKVRRAPKGCPFDPTIIVGGMHLANPAAIIWECLTDTEWGMAGAPSNIDQASFVAAATTLRNEGFGLAMLWHRQESIEDFIGGVLNHIDGSLSLDPFTGRLRLKLIRNDYTLDDLPVFGPHNATLNSFDRRAWGETVNEINVSWTNPANEQTETVTVHDTAVISLLGGAIVSETRDYFGIRTADLALRVATRDLQTASAALATADMTVNRDAWRLLPGDVVALQWPEYDYGRIAMRVTGVDYGKPGDSKIQLSLVEDVFSLPESSYVDSDGSAWVNPAIEPEPLAHQHLTSTPYYSLVLAVGDVAAEQVDDTSDIEMIFGTHPKVGIFSYEIMHRVMDPNGDLEWVGSGTVMPAGRGELATPLTREDVSVVDDLVEVSRGENFVAGALVWVGPINQTGELAVIRSADAAGYTLARGVLDTIPQAWPAGTPVWALHGGVLGAVGEERAIGESPTVRLLTNTALGQLDIAQASNLSGTMTGRLHRPYRPGNLRADGFVWPDPGWYPEYPVHLTWAGRNRLSETVLINDWTDGHVTPEPGTDYRVVVRAIEENGTVNGTVLDIWTTDHDYLLTEGDIPSALAGSPFMEVTVTARRDGLTSWQSPSIRFRGPFRAPTDLFAVYREPTAPTDFNVFILPSE